MKSIVARKARLAYTPVAILWSDEKPEGALQIKPGAQTCIMPFFAQVLTRGKTAVFDRESFGCPGAKAGLGFGSGYPDAFGGAGISLLVAAVSIFNVMMMSVTERVREIGIMRSLGTQKGEILKMFVTRRPCSGSWGPPSARSSASGSAT